MVVTRALHDGLALDLTLPALAAALVFLLLAIVDLPTASRGERRRANACFLRAQ